MFGVLLIIALAIKPTSLIKWCLRCSDSLDHLFVCSCLYFYRCTCFYRCLYISIFGDITYISGIFD